MNRYKTMWVIAALIAAVVGTVLFPQAVYAESGGGEGTLSAEGNGIILLRGNGDIQISGNGVLWIMDHEGDAEITVSGEGRKQEMTNGRTRYAGFEGSASISGSRVTVALSGYDIVLDANGKGRFRLRGEGSFSTGTINGSWEESFKVYSFE